MATRLAIGVSQVMFDIVGQVAAAETKKQLRCVTRTEVFANGLRHGLPLAYPEHASLVDEESKQC